MKPSVLLFLALLFVIPNHISAQTDLVRIKTTSTDTFETNEKPDGRVVTGPVADPSIYYEPYSDVFRVQSGLYVGRRHIGIEGTFFRPGSIAFVDLFFGVTNYRDLNSPSSAAWISGLSVGRDFFLSGREQFIEESKTDLYIRIGPGIGMAGRGIFDNRDTEYFIGLHTKALIGAQYNFSIQTSLYVLGGGRVLWFPALDEVRFTGIPIVSVGLQFSSSPAVPMVRF